MLRRLSPRTQKVLYALIFIVSYGYLLYRLITFENYSAIWAHFHEAGAAPFLSLALCLMLMPVNIRLEAWKWQYSIRKIHPVSFRESVKQVYGGIFAGFTAPYQLADYPMRVVLSNDRHNDVSSIFIGFYGSFVLTLVIALMGIPSAVIFFAGDGGQTLLQILLSAAFVVVGAVACPWVMIRFARNIHRWPSVQKHLEPLRQVSFTDCCVLFLLSFLRYLCFSAQLWILLYAFGVGLTPLQTLQAIPLYYLLVTLTPNMPAVDLGVRGAWALFVFGHYLPEAAVSSTLAVAAIWIINTAIPVCIGGFYFIHHKLIP